MKIKEIEKSIRPREKMIEYGASYLTDSELLAIILSSGNKNESAIDLAKRMIDEYGFKRLLYLNYQELKKIKGIKEAKATKLMAIFEIIRRVSKQDTTDSLNNPYIVYKYIINEYIFKEEEQIAVIYLDKSKKVISKKIYTDNESTSVKIPKRKIVNDAINYNSKAIYLIHNHPSGNVMPSDDDLEATEELFNILYYVEVLLLDHIIIGKNNFYSIREEKEYDINEIK